MKYRLALSSAFKKDCRRIQKQGRDVSKLDKVVSILLSGATVPARYKDHPLKGSWKDFRELHIEPDWLLIYLKNKTELILTLSRTGSHSDLLE